MSYLEWSADLDVQVEEMNDEHRTLIGLMNKFHELSQQESNRLQANRALEELGSFTVEHFTHEEKVMAAMKFPDLERHAAIHKKLLSELDKHVAAYRESGNSEELLMFLKVWLKAHIKGIDTKYGRHAQSAA